MNLDVAVELLTWISLLIALVAAGLWLMASKIIVKAGDPRSQGPVTMKGVDVLSTATEQGRWNSRAAVATAAALVVQASSQAISNWELFRNLMG